MSENYSKALQSCFTSSVRAGRHDLLPDFLAKGLDPNWLDSHGESPMQVALGTEQTEIVQLLEDSITDQSGDDVEGMCNVAHSVLVLVAVGMFPKTLLVSRFK